MVCIVKFYHIPSFFIEQHVRYVMTNIPSLFIFVFLVSPNKNERIRLRVMI